jgi:hypothetical protein
MREYLPTTIESRLPMAPGFGSVEAFELLQRQAKLLAASDLVPKEYKGNFPNCVIALEMASRIGASPLAVLQNLYIVHGKPSWSSTFIIGALNTTGRFSPLRFDISEPEPEREVAYEFIEYVKGNKQTKTGKEKIRNRVCVAWAIEKATGDRLESPPVSLEMAVKEGWLSKNGSKWQTMPDLMLRYRAATFFGRLYASEVLMGMRTDDEMRDIIDISPEQEPATTAESIVSRFADAQTADPTTGEIPMTPDEKAGAQNGLPNMDTEDDGWPDPPGTAVDPCPECGEVDGHAISCPNAVPPECEKEM